MRYLIVLIVVAVVLASVPVEALRTVESNQVIYITPDGDAMEWNETYNASAPEAMELSNYNASAVPFMNASNVSGTFTGPFTPPMFYQVANETNWTNDRVSTIVRFKSEEVMSGSSVSWWRCPALELKNPEDEWTVIFRIWHVDGPGLVDADIVEDLLYNEPNMARTSYVFGRAYGNSAAYGGAENVTYYWQNYTAGDVWDYSDSGSNLSFLWLRVDTMLHADASYLVDWEIWSAADTLVGLGKRLTFTACDVGDNGIYKTWLKFNSTAVLVECDLDVSVVHQYGIGHSVSGWSIDRPPSEGGPAGPTMHPTSGDGFTEAVSPTGTEDGGIWDGDWTGVNANIAVNSGTKTTGTNSIKATSTSGPFQQIYTLDAGVDISNWATINFDYYPASSDCLSFQLYLVNKDYPASGGGHWIFVSGMVEDAWNEVELPINDWVADGWSSYGSPDDTDMGIFRSYMLSATGSGDITRIDQMRFEESGGGGGGGSASVSMTFYDTLEEPPDEVGDYVTFFMPFIFPVDNTTNAKVEIATLNSTWSQTFWVAKNGPCDFAIKSFAWGHDWSSDIFEVQVTFYNTTNAIFVHDDNADYDPWYGAGTTHSNNYFLQRDTSNMTLYGYVFYRPYHSLQVTDGEWLNTQVPDAILFGGRYVNMSDLQMRDESYTPPLVIQIIHGYCVIYNFIDKVLFMDLLPNLDEEHFYEWLSNGLQNIKATYWLINAKIGAFVEVVVAFLEAAGHALAGILRGIILFISVLVFVAICLYSNGVKNFFVVGARYGTVAMGDYAIGFIKRSFSPASFGRWR